jgi:hypothetical protein
VVSRPLVFVISVRIQRELIGKMPAAGPRD